MYEDIVNFIRQLYGLEGLIPLHAPKFVGNEKKYLEECIDSTFVSSVGKFVDRLEDEKLIVPSESNCDNTAKADMPVVNMKFDIPAYQKFDDMQEMLLLDPIHEVSEAGWPNLPEGELN